MNIGIVGGGAVGLLLAAHLGKKNEVHIYVRREEQRRLLEKEGVECNGEGRSVHVHARHIRNDISKHDLFIITVKQKDIAPLLNMDFPPCTPILFLQNGMGHLDKVKKLTRNPIWLGVVEHGALKISDNRVKHTGRGRIKVSSLTGQNNGLSDVVSILNTEVFPFEIVEDYYEMLASKLLVNAVINPLTALFQVPNGAIYTNRPIRLLAKRLCEEACLVLEREMDSEWERVISIARLTSENYSSMYKDLYSGRTTEINAINGYLLSQSTFSLPNHQFALDAIHAIEVRNERG